MRSVVMLPNVVEKPGRERGDGEQDHAGEEAMHPTAHHKENAGVIEHVRRREPDMSRRGTVEKVRRKFMKS